MPGDRDSPTLMLKTGIDVDARAAYVKWRVLEGLQADRPHHFRAFLALARSDYSAVSTEVYFALQEQYHNWFTPDGLLIPIVTNVLLSAYRQTPDGSMLVNPFQLATQAEIDIFEQVERHIERFRRAGFLDDNDFPGPSIL